MGLGVGVGALGERGVGDWSVGDEDGDWAGGGRGIGRGGGEEGLGGGGDGCEAVLVDGVGHCCWMIERLKMMG